MFRSKRHVGGEVVDGGYRTDTDSLLKKQRISNLIFSSVTATTTGSVNSAGEADSSSLVGDSKSGSSTDGPSLPDMTSGDEKPQDIDEDLHSRQLAVYGRETMRWIFAANVLISGMQGLGAEIAKNLILTGVKSVTLHDEGMVELWDLSSNFIFSEDDVGKNRAIASVQKLQELNKAVVVSIVTTKLTKEQLADFQAVVFTNINLETAIAFDDFCHNHKPPIAFIKAEVRGLFGNVFCDFGPTFTVLDVDGEEPHTGIISSIRNENFANVSCIPDKILGFKSGDLVVFSEIRGMSELNDGKPRKIDRAEYYSFTLDEDTTTFGSYEKGGIVRQVKQPRILKFKPLREALKDPDEFLLSDSSKLYRASLVRLAFQALDKFVSELGRLPLSGSEEEARKLISMAVNINENSGKNKLEEIHIDPILLRHFSFGARAVLNPMAAMFGGIVAQEVMKACSRKFTPLFQLFFESVESLPTEQLEPSDFFPLNSRYDAQISVFGSKLQKKLEEAQVFVVGAGALGCEFLKNLALMGVSCNNQGKLTVTDDDIIKKNYLSSQFLFRDWNIGQAKSSVAASAASLINPSLQIEALEERVGHETENVFNDSFWEKQSIIVNAFNNVEARLYVDNRCVYFQKPLLDSGSVGAKCYTQMVIPHLTENYGTTREPPDKPAEETPAEVESFPYKIDHCLMWARLEFKTLLEETPAEVNAYLSNPLKYEPAEEIPAKVKHILERVLECLDKYICKTFQDCISWARLKFEDYFSYRVKELILTYPEDVPTLSGYPFWSAPKRFPHPQQFSATDRSHLQFIMYASILRAETFGIPIPDWAKDPNKYTEPVDKVMVPEFQPKKNAKIVTDDDEVPIFEELIKKLEQCRSTLPSNFRMKPVLFEKDNDTNHHMDLIAALTNMRARNYSIPEVDKLKAKIIAGEILPAIATSAATAAGLVCLELYKVLDGGHEVEDYRNTLVNLALPFFLTPKPSKPKVHEYRNMSWTIWDRWTIEGNPTIRDLVQWLHAKGFYTYTVSAGGVLLFNSIIPEHQERIDKHVVDLLREVAEVEPPPNCRYFDVVVVCINDEFKEVDIPEVSVYFH